MASLGLDKVTLPIKVVIGLFFSVLLAAAYYLMFYEELSSSISAAQNKESQLQRSLSDARQVEQSYQRDLAELTDRQQRQNQLAKVLPSTTEYPAFLSALQTVANVSGVTLTSWSPEPEQVEQFYARVPMNLTLEGRFHHVAKFFYGVGQLDRIINMENISVKDPTVSDKDISVKVNALATAFRTLNATDVVAAKRPGTPAVGGH
ncbi:MAG TPA: type 4a pilus biogenesis protein PilO [Polyangiaceae bacterium]